MRSTFITLIFSIIHIGCSSSYIVSSSRHDERLSFAEFNAAAKNEKAKIVFQDASILNVQGVMSNPDSTTWLPPTNGMKVAVSTRKIKKVILTNRTLGAFEGAGFGILAGGGLGFLTAAILADPSDFGRFAAYILLPAIGGGVGLLAGTVVGVTSGHTYEYEFVHEMEKPSD